MARKDDRAPGSLRPVKMTHRFTRYAEGSVLYQQGNTQVLCTASVQDSVPPFLRGKGQGWVTAEYGMLPRATHTRTDREAAKGKQSGRTQEIQRLIRRALRACVDMKAFGERSRLIDCDVLQADGGTRTASITGGCVALAQAMGWLVEKKGVPAAAFVQTVAAVSVGIVDGQPMLDLDYDEDSTAGVDMNIVMTGDGRLIEVQGTAEHQPFTPGEMKVMVSLASRGIRKLVKHQYQTFHALHLPFKM